LARIEVHDWGQIAIAVVLEHTALAEAEIEQAEPAESRQIAQALAQRPEVRLALD
jgi:hypothetical protein